MPQATKAVIAPSSLEPYISSCVALAQENLSHFASLAEITAREKDLNRYPRLERLSEPREILVLDEHGGSPEPLARARARWPGEKFSSNMPSRVRAPA